MSKETKNLKQKTKEFWENNKRAIVVGAASVGTVILCEVVLHKNYKEGVLDGVALGFNHTIDWFDEQKPDLKLREFWDEYRKLHPEKVATRHI